MLKMVYAAEIMYGKCQIKAANIYMVPIYMYSRLGLGVYSLYIYIYIAIYRPMYKGQPIYMYIYIYKYTLESGWARLNLALATQWSYRKLWYTTLSLYI